MNKENIISWLSAWFKKKDSSIDIGQNNFIDQNYFEAGYIDSLGIMHLIMEIEQEFSIKFTETHFQDRRFPSINGLSDMILEVSA